MLIRYGRISPTTVIVGGVAAIRVTNIMTEIKHEKNCRHDKKKAEVYIADVEQQLTDLGRHLQTIKRQEEKNEELRRENHEQLKAKSALAADKIKHSLFGELLDEYK